MENWRRGKKRVKPVNPSSNLSRDPRPLQGSRFTGCGGVLSEDKDVVLSFKVIQFYYFFFLRGGFKGSCYRFS